MRRRSFALMLAGSVAAGMARAADLWQLARSKRQIHQFSTLFTAQDVRDRLAQPGGIEAAIDWCRKTGVTKVYIETYRDGYEVEQETLIKVRDAFRKADFAVAGCVTPTRIGKPSTGSKLVSCYSDHPTQTRVEEIFQYAAAFFDELMVDDWLFTDCTCEVCDNARRTQTVNIEGRINPVRGQSWQDYRRTLMLWISRDQIIGAAKKLNPNVRLTIKYPMWYDQFQDRGYDVVRETAEYDKIWAGTETRDLPGGAQPYRAYFLMRWLEAIGQGKAGGGWYDPLNTTPKTYVEQARQTVLGGARETVLFSYGALSRQNGPADIEALRQNIPELLEVAEQVQRRRIAGLAAYKPPHSNGGTQPYVFDYIGMLGFPLVPYYQFPEDSRAAFFPLHAREDPEFLTKGSLYIASGRPVLITQAMAETLDPLLVKQKNVRVLSVGGDPKSLLNLTQEELDPIRDAMLAPFKTKFHAPSRVGLYLFTDGSYVIENFRDEAVTVELNGASLQVPARGWTKRWK
ncbi:MAG TPA: hypothetical protein PLA43_03615 [Bryobacteraceae bacterium]|nr:hypothetical protein [Bryobacteraceae bacterium]HOQ47627.1 hypothetical protein [Bryobacteraceae bacterium]HPQ14564.1 hypothetical protein [Bryobacteraceae bacterium]HPU71017.1 hypothetical protein [Bryobacteraceae bacterium]